MKISKSLLEAAAKIAAMPVNQHSPKGNFVVESYEAAERHHDLAKKHKDNPARYAEHMQKYHEMSAEWSRSKGRHRVADQHDAKAELFADDLKKHKALKEEEQLDESVLSEEHLAEDKVTVVHKGDGGHHRITVGTIKAGPHAGKHFVDAKFDTSNDPHKPSGHGSNQSLANYVHKGDGTAEKRSKLHNALVAAHKTGDKKKVLAAVKEHGYSHHNWQLHESGQIDEAVSSYASEDAARAVAAKLKEKHNDKGWGHAKKPDGRWYVTHADHSRADIKRHIGKLMTEDKMTDDQKAHAERIVKGLKDNAESFKKKYGADWEGVMYATANKMAMKEDVDVEIVKMLGEARYYHLARGESHGRHYKDEHGVTWDDEGYNSAGTGPSDRRERAMHKAKPAATKHYHEVPYAKKEDAKREGMKWHAEKKKWYHTDAGKSATSKFKKLHESYDDDEYEHHDHSPPKHKIGDKVHYHGGFGGGQRHRGEITGHGHKNGERVYDVKLDNGQHHWGYEHQFKKLHEEELSEELRERLAANAAANKDRTPIAGVDKTKKTDEKRGLHRVAVTVSDPNHPAVSQRKETVQKFVKVRAGGRFEAEGNARRHYQKQGYKVHDVNHHSEIKEEVEGVLTSELFTEEHATREAAQKRLEAIEKKHPLAKHSVIQGRRTGKWHVVRHTSGGMHVVEGYEPEFDELIEDCGLDSKGDWQNYKSKADKKKSDGIDDDGGGKKAKDNIKEGDESEADYQKYKKEHEEKRRKEQQAKQQRAATIKSLIRRTK